jgi:hypothetical protein
MDKALSYLISAIIITFGVWIVVGIVTTGSPMALDALGAAAPCSLARSAFIG